MERYLRLVAAVAAATTIGGCATVTRGTSQKFEFVSQPPGADVSTSTGVTCVTPCKLKVKRRPGFVATITKAGYKPAQVTVESKIKGGGVAGAAGNVLLGGIIGGVVDGSNGSLNTLTPNPVSVTLTPEAAAGPVVEPAAAAPAVTSAAPKE